VSEVFLVGSEVHAQVDSEMSFWQRKSCDRVIVTLFIERGPAKLLDKLREELQNWPLMKGNNVLEFMRRW